MITIVAVSKNHLVRLGLQGIIETKPYLRLVGEATSEAQAEAVVARERPHVIVIELVPEFDVSRLTRKIKEAVPTTRMVLLSGFDMRQGTWEALAPEVDGMVLNVQPPAVLVAAIEHVCLSAPNAIQVEGNGIGHHAIDRRRDILAGLAPSPLQWPGSFTEREREIITLVGQGFSNKDIADRLCISCITVRHHLTRIFDKLGVTNRQKLLIRVYEYGLVESKLFS